MDLTPDPFTADQALDAAPAEWSTLLGGIAARQGCSATAAEQAAIDAPRPRPTRFAPADGSFNRSVAAAMEQWRSG